FTQSELDLAKKKLSELPDLSINRISRDDVLTAITEDIVLLAKTKGYTVADIKLSLTDINIIVSEKLIQEVIKKGKVTPISRGRPKSGYKKSDTNVAD
ncbi:hypothetical protein J1782_01005, partial [Rahnella sp. BCC 1045]|uniref:hypothetical protein n=1 Tax=Rahnella sp. BCC 1045 TaxID=2816251 RepID=UPI001C2568CC